jgi:hypothetical protein
MWKSFQLMGAQSTAKVMILIATSTANWMPASKFNLLN